MLHPNYVNTFFEIVREVYCSGNMDSLAKDLIFTKFKEQVAGDNLLQMQKLETEFYNNMDDFKIEDTNFNPKYCYKYEGSKS